jgi:iron(III) transport system substrate-binding protein
MHAARSILCLLCLCLLAAGCGGDTTESPDKPPGPPVVVYAAQDKQVAQSIMDAYTTDTGVSILLTTESGRALLDKLSAEKHRATADLFISDGIAYLWAAAERDILRPSNSELLRNNIPDNLRDQENLWFALKLVSRTIAYDKRTIEASELSGYAALGDEKWHDKLCLSSSTNAGNRSHVAMMVAEHGDHPAEVIVRSWINNLATSVVADDARLLAEIDEGLCGLGIVNADRAERHIRENSGTSIAMYWPPDSEGGTYVDIAGAAVTRHAGNPAGAVHLLEWLSSRNGINLTGGSNADYRISPVSLGGAGFYQEDAVRLMERAHWAE